MGYAAMAWAIAPMLGPTIGGTLDELFGWRMVFVVLALVGAAVLILSMRELKETASLSTRPTGTLYVFLAGAPLAIGGSSAVLGLYMGMIPAGFICGSYLTGHLGAAIHRTTLLILARLLTCAGLLAGPILAFLGVTHPLAFFGPCMFIGIGNGLTLPAANMGAMSVRNGLAGTAAGLAAAMSIGGGALIVSIAGLFLGGAIAVESLLCATLVTALFALLASIFAAVTERRHAGTVS